MKTIRYLAAFLLLLTGVLHVSLTIANTSDPSAMPVLAFGIIYLAVAVLFFLGIKFAKYLGLVFPLIGLAAGFGVIGVRNWTGMQTLLFAINAVVAICCISLIVKRGHSEATQETNSTAGQTD
jgi:hypothetical protein